MSYLNYPNTTIKRIIIISFILTIIGFLIYLDTLHSEFITEWDDSAYVVNNTLIRSLNWDSIYRIFTTPHYTDYYPLTLLSYATDYQIWGLNPFGYRLTNLVIHILNSILLYLFIHSLLSRHTAYKEKANEAIATLAALIFLAHPVNVETVAWISERKNVLSMTFFIIAFYCYSSYRIIEKRYYYDASLLFFLFALLSKSSVVIFPVLITFYDYLFFYKKGASRLSLLTNKIPFFILAAIFSSIIILVHTNIGALHEHPNGSRLYTFLTIPGIVVTYINKSFFPFNLSPFYATMVSESIFEPHVIASISILLITMAISISLRHVYKLLLFFLILYFIPLLPVLHVIPIAIFMADRYLYIPMIGFAFMSSFSLYALFERLTSKSYQREISSYMYLLFSLSFISLLAMLTIRQGDVWRDGISVWAKVVKENPRCANTYLPLVISYLRQDKYLDAYAYTTKALELGLTGKERKDAHYFRAIALIFHGDPKRGERELERLRDIDPKFPMLFYGFGVLYAKKGESENAIESLEKFLTLYEPPYKNFEDPLITDANKAIKKLKEIQAMRK